MSLRRRDPGPGRVGPWSLAWWVSNPAAAGGGLLVVLAVIVAATAPLQLHGRRELVVLEALAAGLAVVWAVTGRVAWARWSPAATLVFPVLGCGWLAAVGLAAPAGAPAYMGLLVPCFTDLGLAHPRRTCLVLLPAAVAAYLVMIWPWSSTVAVRLTVAVLVWLSVAETIAALVGRQRGELDDARSTADTDPLTGLLNRRGLDRRIGAAPVGAAVVVCDLDHFKRVDNDHGHAAGDLVRADFSDTLRTCAGKGEGVLVARTGGEEFLLVLPDGAAADVLGRVRTVWAVLHPAVTFSAGVATHTGSRPVTDTLEMADVALYEAKRAGRNRDCAAADLTGRHRSGAPPSAAAVAASSS